MKKNSQILILLTPIISLLLLVFFRWSVFSFDSIENELIMRVVDAIRPFYAFFYIAFLISLYAFTSYKFSRNSSYQNSWWNFLLLPACFSTSVVSFIVLNSDIVILRILFILNFLFIYLYFRTIYSLLNFKEEKDHPALENMSSYGNFLAVYFLSAAIYGLQSFLNIPVYYLMIFFVVFIAIVVYQVFWANELNLRKSLLFIFLICMVLLQLAWSISFLTLSYYMLGLILAIYYYVLIGLMRFHLRGNMDKKIVKLYIIFGAISMLSVLITATWL